MNKTIASYTYNSLSEMAAAVAAITPNSEGLAFTSSSKNHFDTNGDNFDQCLHRAANGGEWAQGSRALQAVELDTGVLDVAQDLRPQLVRDVVGYCPNVPEYLSGEPEHMMNVQQAPVANKLIKIAVSVVAWSGVEDSDILYRGRAILELVNALTLSGYAVELWAVNRVARNSQRTQYTIDTCVKQASQFWSPDSVAFALCHSGFQRRLCWRIAETNKKLHRLLGSGYGTCDQVEYPDYDIAFPLMRERRSWGTPTRAMATVKAVAVKALARLQHV